MPKLLVIFHIYYQDQVPYFLEHLANITCPYDLIVTSAKLSSCVEQQLRAFKPDIKIIQVSNRGYDMWPFLQAIYQTDLSQYTYVLKLHTKQLSALSAIKLTGQPLLWRDCLLQPLLGSRQIFEHNLHLLQQAGVGLCAGYFCFLQRGFSLPEDTYLYDRLCNTLHCHHSSRWFVAGSMFLIRTSCLEKLKAIPFTQQDFSPLSKSGSSSTLAHALERIFVPLVLEKNLKVHPAGYPNPSYSWQTYLQYYRYQLLYILTTGQRKIHYDIKRRDLRLCLKGKI